MPRELVMGVPGRKDGLGGILRATGAGLLLDLCSHGILLVGMKLYERGASIGLIRVSISTDTFAAYFGPTLFGLIMTLVATTIIEVCSEGSSPIAADLLTRASAPGNAFTFLMAGAATDYTEIMDLKERSGSWKIALFLPLVTVPQVLLLGYILNVMG